MDFIGAFFLALLFLIFGLPILLGYFSDKHRQQDFQEWGETHGYAHYSHENVFKILGSTPDDLPLQHILKEPDNNFYYQKTTDDEAIVIFTAKYLKVSGRRYERGWRRVTCIAFQINSATAIPTFWLAPVSYYQRFMELFGTTFEKTDNKDFDNRYTLFSKHRHYWHTSLCDDIMQLPMKECLSFGNNVLIFPCKQALSPTATDKEIRIIQSHYLPIFRK